MDTVSKEVRSKIMAAVKGKDTKPEIAVRKLLHSLGYRYRLHKKELPGSPDIFLKKYDAVIYVHGCFWHHHKGCKHATVPKSNVAFWTEKLKRNVHRDKENIMALKRLGYKVKVIWECQTTNIKLLDYKLRGFLNNNAKE